MQAHLRTLASVLAAAVLGVTLVGAAPAAAVTVDHTSEGWCC